MYLSLMHEFMKLMDMSSKVFLFTFSKYGQLITPSIHSRDNIRKTRNNRKIKRSKPLSQDFVHFEPVESPVYSSTMESLGWWCAEWVCLVFVHHQRLDPIVLFSQGASGVARSSRTETVDSPGASTIFNGSDVWCTFRIISSLLFYLGKIFNSSMETAPEMLAPEVTSRLQWR